MIARLEEATGLKPSFLEAALASAYIEGLRTGRRIEVQYQVAYSTRLCRLTPNFDFQAQRESLEAAPTPSALPEPPAPIQKAENPAKQKVSTVAAPPSSRAPTHDPVSSSRLPIESASLPTVQFPQSQVQTSSFAIRDARTIPTSSIDATSTPRPSPLHKLCCSVKADSPPPNAARPVTAATAPKKPTKQLSRRTDPKTAEASSQTAATSKTTKDEPKIDRSTPAIGTKAVPKISVAAAVVFTTRVKSAPASAPKVKLASSFGIAAAVLPFAKDGHDSANEHIKAICSEGFANEPKDYVIDDALRKSRSFEPNLTANLCRPRHQGSDLSLIHAYRGQSSLGH